MGWVMVAGRLGVGMLVVSTTDRQVNTGGRSGTFRRVDSVLPSLPAHLCLPSLRLRLFVRQLPFVDACNHLPRTPLNYSRWPPSSPLPGPPLLLLPPQCSGAQPPPPPFLVHWRNVDQNAEVIFVSSPRGGGVPTGGEEVEEDCGARSGVMVL